ncbi:Phosphodiesterase/alkaline phosphatase D [Chromobacterium vaccinii]|nr:Phosphodiesterase/alkaline phosphatase D [Chromobacterium vaccinii]QND90637.1 Phosphodiesterase/alkaline phosphatase D [Chromobacterium vaccinii]
MERAWSYRYPTKLRWRRICATAPPKVVYQKAPPEQNASPLAGMQFFGQVDIDARSRAMTVRLKDVAGQTLFSQELPPA